MGAAGASVWAASAVADRAGGESHHFGDYLFAYGATAPPPPAFVSTVKIKQADFCDTFDTEGSFALVE